MERRFGGSEDHYAVLGLSRDCTASQIRNAYRELVIRWHPDKCRGVDPDFAKRRFQTIQEAYNVLSNDYERFLYDASSGQRQDNYGMDDFLSELQGMMDRVSKDPNDTIDDLRCALQELVTPFETCNFAANDFPQQMWNKQA